MNRWLILLLLVWCCGSPSKYKDIDAFLADYPLPEEEKLSLYVFDEYACSICFENLLHQLPDVGDYQLLFASKRWQKFSYEDSQLIGFIPKEHIIPVDYSIIALLHKSTETFKGNYLIELEGGKVSTLTALDQ